MRKTAVANVFLLTLLAAPMGARAERFFRGDETGVAVSPTNQNYYVSTLLGESEHYAPTFYDDYLLTLGGKAVAHFTKMGPVPVDFYWYVTDPEDLSYVGKAFLEHRSTLDGISPKILSAFSQYEKTAPTYAKKGLYAQTMEVIKDITSVAPQKVMGDGHLPQEVEGALYQYLRSNGVSSLAQLRQKPDLINMLVNKFYMLSTTYFYRDYPYVKAFLPYLEPIKTSLSRERRPFKVHVFACSTGEEVITYAVELMEAGITDFTILASDINEPGLRHASEFRYSYTALERLPLATQDKIKKYFRFNPKLGIWEPANLDLFKSRIKYVYQDLLKDLPSDIDPRFAPPYDLVSIMNVLFYLEDAAVQSRKDAWARMVAPGGILVLHDFHYSLMTGTLGREWAFKNFLSVNEWVNVRTGSDMPTGKKIDFYEKNNARNPSEGTFMALIQAYVLGGQLEKAQKMAEEYTQKNPRSAQALDVLWEFYRQGSDPGKTAAVLDRLVRLQPESLDTLSKLIETEDDRKEKDFLRALRKAEETFLSGLKSQPQRVEGIFDFKEPSSQKYDLLRLLLKIHAYGALQNHYLSRKYIPDADRVGREGLQLAETVLPRAAGYPCLVQFLDQLAGDLLEYDVENSLPDKALETGDRIAAAFNPVFKDLDTFYTHSLYAHLALYKAMAFQKLGKPAEARAAVQQSLPRFEKARGLLEELMPSRRPFFYGDEGLARMVYGELLAQAGEADAAHAEDERALVLLEEGLSYNPLYGKSMSTRRAELLRRRQAAKPDSVPLAGSVLRFRDEYGPYTYTSEVVHYKSEDGAQIEATLLTPEEGAPKRPGLVFVHMWARDRNTWWGLPEFLASYGYPAIYMDLRGHGASTFPNSTHQVTIRDDESWRMRYGEFVRDVLPAVDRLLLVPSVKEGRVIMFGASLGCPVGTLAADLRRDKVMGMVMLSPSIEYFGVDCRTAMARMSKTPLFVMAEKNDESFRGAKEFFNLSDGYKTYLQTDYLGHGTDAVYRDVGLPTILHGWLEQLETLDPFLQKIRNSHPLLSVKKK